MVELKNMKKIFVKVEGIKVINNIKKTPEQKIRDYFKQPKWHALTKKQKKEYVEYKSK